MHAASVHLPISLALLGVPLVFLAFFAPKRWPGLRLFSATFYFFASLVAILAALTGQRAASELVALANDEIQTVVTHHRLLGFSIAALPLVISILLVASHLRVRSGGRFLAGLAALNAVALAAVVTFAGSSGGRLVYGFGIGTPIVGVDGVSGATAVVGAYKGGPIASTSPPAFGMDTASDAKYTPHTKPIDPAQAASITFKNDVLPLLERRCFKCHRGQDAEAGLDLSTHAGILKGGDYAGPAVMPGAPDNSPIVLHIRGIYLPKMPKDAEELSENDLHTIRMWVSSGAKGE
ncbi:MAG: c-type cytochrome domain-containing protein [Candidatus Hydrogenedentales bacterium]|jgi:uncharacterized membrane protein